MRDREREYKRRGSMSPPPAPPYRDRRHSPPRRSPPPQYNKRSRRDDGGYDGRRGSPRGGFGPGDRSGLPAESGAPESVAEMIVFFSRSLHEVAEADNTMVDLVAASKFCQRVDPPTEIERSAPAPAATALVPSPPSQTDDVFDGVVVPANYVPYLRAVTRCHSSIFASADFRNRSQRTQQFVYSIGGDHGGPISQLPDKLLLIYGGEYDCSGG